MRRLTPLIFALALLVEPLNPGRVAAYTYQGSCDNNQNEFTWDALRYPRSNTNGVEMDQLRLPPSSSWATCTGSTGFGHVAELASLTGTGTQLVQVGIIKNISQGSTSWLFMYTANDNLGGVVVDAGSLFGEEPIAGRTYWLHIMSYHDPSWNWYWEYGIKDFYNGRQVFWTRPATWHTGSLPWFAGETADKNDTMGARPQASTFLTYAMRVSDLSTGWQPWLTDADILADCYSSGYNASIVHCNVKNQGTYPGLYIWNS
jgi:hypothetical protein